MKPAGRPISVLLAILGMDQHEVGARAVARILRDAGIEVVYAGRFNLPAGIAKVAMEEDVDLIGLSCHSWEYLYYVDELLALLPGDRRIPVVVGGSVITPADARTLAAKGVGAAFGPGSTPEEIVATVRRLAAAEGPR